MQHRQIIAVLIVAASLALAGYQMQDREVDLRRQLVQLHQEKDQLAGQVADMEKQLKNLQESHELYIAVTEDIDQRLVRAEQGRGAGP